LQRENEGTVPVSAPDARESLSLRRSASRFSFTRAHSPVIHANVIELERTMAIEPDVLPQHFPATHGTYVRLRAVHLDPSIK
jgi:hypothetical protein